MRKTVLAVVALFVLFAAMLPQISFAAESSIQLYLNGKKLNPEVAPRKIGPTSMVPVRIISENLGAKVFWFQSEQKVIVEKDTTTIELWINKTQARINDKPVTLESAPVLISGNTLLPVRVIAENLGVTVNWDDATQTVNLFKNQDNPSGTPNSPAPIVLPTDNRAVIQSMQVNGDSLVIEGNGPLAPKMFTLSGPSRLVIDLPQTTFGPGIMVPGAGQMGGVYTYLPQVSGIRYAINDPATSTIRVVIEFAGAVSYNVIDNGPNKVVIQFPPQPVKKYKVVLDAGHGDTDSGAISITGKREADFTLSMVLKVKALLEKDPRFEVYTTRSTDVFIPLNDRVSFANNLNADLFLSIHGNNWTATTDGTQTYYYNDYSLPFAQIMHKQVVAATGFRDDKVRFSDFRVIHGTKMPGILIEVGYLSNATEEAQMYSPDFQDRVAAAMVAGMKQYLNLN